MKRKLIFVVLLGCSCLCLGQEEGQDPAKDDFRDHMRFVGELVSRERPLLARKIKDLALYLESIPKIEVELVRTIEDPKFGILTAKVIPAMITPSHPTGWKIQLSEERWRLLLEGRLGVKDGPESDPFQLAFQVSLKATGQEPVDGEAYRNLRANHEEFERWIDRGRYEELPAASTFGFVIELRSGYRDLPGLSLRG